MKHIFGKTKAALTLERLVSDNPSARRKVSNLLSEYTYGLLSIINDRHPKIVRLCMSLYKDYTLEKIEEKTLSLDVKTFTKNVVVARYRVFLKEYNYVIRLKQERMKNI